MKPRCLRWLAAPVILGTFLAAAPLGAQQPSPVPSKSLDFTTSNWFPNIMSPYFSPAVPEARLTNTQRLHSLIRNGELHLTIEDTLSMALENNLDIAVARYNISYAQTDILRTQGGGAARGFAGSFQSGALFAGALGGGVSAGGQQQGGRGGGATAGASATQLAGGGTFDPSVFFSMGWDRNTSPLNFTTVQGVPVVTSQATNYTVGYNQAFQSGTSVAFFTGGNRGTTTSLTQLFNPSVNTFMAVGFNQPLLNGFGRRANSVQIRIAQNDLKVAASVFRQQVITTVSAVLNLYWDYVAFQENVRVAEQALALAQKLLSDNKRQVEIGTLAPIEVVRAESEVAARQQDLIVAQTNLQQQAELIKTAISKQVDPELASAKVVTENKLPEPRPDDVPPLDEALRLAAANRPELEQNQLKLIDQDYTIKARRNSLLPQLDLFATYIGSGLAGNRASCPAGASAFGTRCVDSTGNTVPPLGIISGGAGDALSQTWAGDFPDYSFGVRLSIPIRNRAAQADAARALLERRQLETQVQQQKNKIAQDVRNAEIAVIQAKAQIEAAAKAVTLARQTLDAEQKKFQLGESTVFLVIQAQRDLATAEGNEVRARSTYSKALTQFLQATGTTLTHHNIELTDAMEGKVTKSRNIPGSAETPHPTVGTQQGG
ncbi:MAG: TolC family protein [Terriglobia bacterium]